MSISPERIGFLGAGHMGSAMLARLCAAGFPVTVFDLSPVALVVAITAGADAAPDAASAVRGADLVLCSRPTSAVFTTVADTVLASAVGGSEGFRREVAHLAGRIAVGEGESIDAKHAELEYFLADAAAVGQPMPLTAAFAVFCKGAPKLWRDNMGRPYASIWHQLRRRST
jgi:hypothetical protein